MPKTDTPISIFQGSIRKQNPSEYYEVKNLIGRSLYIIMEEAGAGGLEGGLEEQRKPLTNSPEALAWGAELQLAGKSGRPVTWTCQGGKVYGN